MFNILISKTDPYSFMGLIKQSRTGNDLSHPLLSLINAGLVSVFFIVVIAQMAQATQDIRKKSEALEIQSNLNQTTSCKNEACHLV